MYAPIQHICPLNYSYGTYALGAYLNLASYPVELLHMNIMKD